MEEGRENVFCWMTLGKSFYFGIPCVLIKYVMTRQAPLSMEFSRQEYWSGKPIPSPGDLPDSGIEPRSPALQVDSLPSESLGKPRSARVFTYLMSTQGIPKWNDLPRVIHQNTFSLPSSFPSPVPSGHSIISRRAAGKGAGFPCAVIRWSSAHGQRG